MKISMNPASISTFVIIVATFALVGWLLLSPNDSRNSHDHRHVQNHQREEASQGPHGGRLLLQDDFELEVTIYESGLPPEFRVYAYHKNQPVEANKVNLDIELTRLGNKVDQIKFSPQDDYLRGNSIVYEPHSFEVSVNAAYGGKTYAWHYENFEGRTRIPENISQEMGIQTENAGPVNLTETRTLTGRVQTNPNRLSRVRPRYPGIVTAIHRELGDVVSGGDILATVQSNESL